MLNISTAISTIIFQHFYTYCSSGMIGNEYTGNLAAQHRGGPSHSCMDITGHG